MRLPSPAHAIVAKLPGGLELLLLVLLCWQSAGVFWTVFSPSTQEVSLAMPRQGADRGFIVRESFLNWYASQGTAAVEEPEVFKLVGVIAGANGAAVFKKADGTSIAVRLGEELVPGQRLVSLEADQVTLERNGVEKVFTLSPKMVAASTPISEGDLRWPHVGSAMEIDPQQIARPPRVPVLPPRITRSAPPNTGLATNAQNANALAGSRVIGADGSSSSGGNGSIQADAVSQLGGWNGQAASTGSVGGTSGAGGAVSGSTATSSGSTTTTPGTSTGGGSTPPKNPLPITLSRGELLGIMQGGNLALLDKGLSSAPEGGIRVDNVDIQPFGKVLQLKNGDVLKSVNNKPLTQLSDLSQVLQSFGNSSSVDLVMVRDGATLTQHYDIQI